MGQLSRDLGGGGVVRAHLQNLLKVLAGKRRLIGFLVRPSQMLVNIRVLRHFVRFLQLKRFLKIVDRQRANTLPVIDPSQRVGNDRRIGQPDHSVAVSQAPPFVPLPSDIGARVSAGLAAPFSPCNPQAVVRRIGTAPDRRGPSAAGAGNFLQDGSARRRSRDRS